MRIVIIGVGEVGFHVAKALSQEDHDIIVMDLDPAKCKRATESLDVIELKEMEQVHGTFQQQMCKMQIMFFV